MSAKDDARLSSAQLMSCTETHLAGAFGQDQERQKAERRRGECAERAQSKGFEEIDEATYTAKERQRAGHRETLGTSTAVL